MGGFNMFNMYVMNFEVQEYVFISYLYLID